MPTEQRKKRRPFTLLEVMCVVFLGALIIGALGFQIPRAINEERFEKSVALVRSKWTLAHETMLATGRDVDLTLMETEEGVAWRLVSPLKTQEGLLRTIKSFEFDGKKRKTLTLRFQACNATPPQGELLLVGSKKRLVFEKKERRDETTTRPPSLSVA